MIFKTIDDNDSLSGQRIVSKFTARKIAQEEATKQLEIDIQCLRNYEVECQKGSVSTGTFSNTMKGASIEAQKYATNIKNGTGSAQTFAANQRTIHASMSETSIVSKVAATGLSIFKAALNSLIFFAVIEGIQLLIKGIDNLILTADEAEEKAEALRGNMQSFFDEVQSGQQTISSVSDRFSELSEHVTKTGENIDLTKDEYSEYLDICNQVKTIMPELVTGYTNEGNAIITLKDNVDSLTESYKENIRAKAAAFITNGDDDGNTIQSFFDDYKIFTQGENGLFAPSAGGLWNNKSTDYEDYYGYDKVYEWLEDVADLSLKDLQNLQKGTTQATYLYALLKENGYELANITEDNYEAVHDVLDTRLTSLEGEMATRVSNVKMSLQQMLYADRDYWDIDDKKALSAIDSMFSSIDSEFIKQNNLLGKDALQSFESNVVKLFEDKDTQKAMIDIYTPQGDDESIKDYSKRVNDAIEEVKKYIKDNNLNVSLDFGTDENPKGIKESVDKLEKSYDQAIDRFSNHATEKQNKAMAEAQQNLTDEYGKIHDWGLDDYADQIKNGTLPSQFGNVDMDNRQIIDWNIDNIEKWKDALSDIKYYDEDGNFLESYYDQLEESAKNGENCIDTVFGDLMDKIEGYGDIAALSFSHVVNNDDGTFEFLGQKTAEEYLYGILDVAKKDGDMSIDHILELDKKGFKNAEVYDAQGKVIGETYIHGIISGFNDNAKDVSELTHFAGKFGAVQIAKDEISELEKQFGKDGSQTIADFFDTEDINTQEELDYFNDVTKNAKTAEEAIKAYTDAKKESNETPTSFSDLLDTSEYKDIKEKLLNLAKSGEITPETLSSTEEYNALLTKTGTTAEDATNQILDMLSVQEKLSGLSQGLDKLKSAYEEFKDEDIGFVTAKTLESLPDAFKNLPQFDIFEQIVGNPKSGTAKIQQAFNDIVKAYLLSQDTLTGLVNASSDEVQSYIANLKEMGITNAEEVVNETTAVLNSENEMINKAEKEYSDYLENKNGMTIEYVESVVSCNGKLIKALGSAYKSDYDNWLELLKKKGDAYNRFVDAIGGSYDDSLSLIGNMQNNGQDITANTIADAAAAQAEYEKIAKKYNELKDSLKIDLSPINTDFGTSYSPSTNSSSSSAKQVTTETIDFIEIALDRLSTKISELDKTASNAYLSMSKRSKAYQSEIDAVTSQITLQNQAYSAYMAKANSIGLSESWASQIRNGSLNIADITDDTLKEQIKNYQTWYEKALDAKNAVSDLEEKVIQLKTAKIQLEIDVKADKLEQIEAKYDKLQSKLDLRDSFSQLGSEKDYKTLNKYVSQQIKNLNEQNELVKQQQSIVKKGSESWYEYQSTIDSNNSSIQSLTKSMVENAQTMAELANTKADNKVDAYDSADELLKARIENSSSYKKQNSYINKEIANIKNRQKAYDAAVSTNKSNLNSASKKITKTKQTKGSKLDKTYNSIVKEAQSCVKSKKEISGSLIQKAQSLYPDFARAMAEYNAQLASYNTSKATADLYKETSKQDKIDLAKQKSDNIETYYSNRQKQISQRVQEINDNISIIEAEGYAASKEYYKKLISLEKKNNKSLTEEKAKLVSQLQSALKDKSIDVNSNEYYELQAQIDDITNSINQSTLSLAQFEKELQQLKWDNFDSLESKISNLASEMDFLVNEFSNEDLTDSDTGKLTDAGNAVMGLRASKYTAFTQQINDYKKQIESIDKELAKDPYNETLIDRKQALYEAYQSVISAAQDEKYAIIDLAKQGYDALLDRIKDLISKYEELLDSQKDAYEYQQKMDELVKERSAIQKQLAANAGDISEEGRANIQKLNVQLQEAEKSIQEAQYDKMISAQKDMLSDLQDDMTEAVQDIVDSLSENFETLIAQINANSIDIAQTISAKMDEIGYVSSSNFRDLLDGSSITTETRNVVNGIKAFQTSMEAYFKALVEDITSKDSSNEALKKLQSSSIKSIVNNRDKAKTEADSHHEARDVAKSEFDAKQAEVNDLSHRKSEQEMNVVNAREAYQSALAKYGAKSSKTRKAESNYNYQLSILNSLEDRINKSNSQLEELYQKYKTEKSAYSTANAKYKALDYLANHLNAGSKTADEYSDVNKALFTQYSGMVLSGDEMKELAELLGVKYNNAKSSGNLYKKLKSLSIPGFKVGSRYIPDDMLVTLGEDDMTELHFDADKGVLRQVGKGDKVFTNEMTNRLWELAQPNAFDFTSKLIPANFPTATRNTSENINVTFGDIQMYGVNDPDAFAKQLREEICKNGKTTKCIVEAVSAKQLGKTGVGNARLYQR